MNRRRKDVCTNTSANETAYKEAHSSSNFDVSFLLLLIISSVL
jgi:hypothetical protein